MLDRAKRPNSISRVFSSEPAYAVRSETFLPEYGIVLPQAISRLRRSLPEVLEDAENELTVQGRELIALSRAELQ
jgi:transposase